MVNNYSSETEQKILNAARKVITGKGKAGARMQEIAIEAGVNKALLHYYFRSKDLLFERILSETLDKILDLIQKNIKQNISMKIFIRNFINHHIDFIADNLDMIKFFLSEISTNWEETSKIMKARFKLGEVTVPNFFLAKINNAIENGEIRRVDPFHLIVNILSLDIFFFIFSPVMFAIMDIPIRKQEELIDERKEEVFNIIWEYIRIKD